MLLTRTAFLWNVLHLMAGCQAWVQQLSHRRPQSTSSSSLSLSATLNVNNIVLSPSSDASAFDSFKIGCARVHRYSRDQDPDSETEYVMWYHGRSREMSTNQQLPPLSTGRIGRATSRNGLIWVKDTAGSASEDIPGVSLGLNNDSWWGFDVSHLGLGNVLLPMSTPAVLTEGGVYLMFYHGGNCEESPVQDFMERELPASMKDATLQGMKMRVGVAISQDGITWGRVEGDHPTGAVIVPYDKTDPNSWDNIPRSMEEELYCAWPDVVVNLDGEEKSKFVMFYSTMLKGSKEKCIAYATSPDGFRWSKQGLCLRPSESGLDAAGCARCCVVRDARFDEAKRTWVELKNWKMYYEGVSREDNKHRILLAESRDGKKWNKIGIAVDVGSEGAWDCGGVGAPHVVRIDDGSERIYYTGQGADGSTAIGVAKLVNEDGTTRWIREQASFSFR